MVGIYAIVGTAGAFRWAADLDRLNAARLLGAPLRGAYADHGGSGLRARVSATFGDPQTRRDALWVVAHSFVGLALGAAAVGLVVEVLGMATLPLWYWALPTGTELWGAWWTVDTLPEALLAMVLSVPLAAIAVGLLRVMAAAELGLAQRLLASCGTVAPAGAPVPAARPRRRRDPNGALAVHIALAALAGFVCTLLWGLTGAGYLWPAWVWIGLAFSIVIHAAFARGFNAAGDSIRLLRVEAELALVVFALCVAVWALAGCGYFWPVWVAIGFGTVLLVWAAIAYRHRRRGSASAS